MRGRKEEKEPFSRVAAVLSWSSVVPSACPHPWVTLQPAAPSPTSACGPRAGFSTKYFTLVTRVFSAICFKSYGWAHRHSGVFVFFCFLFRVCECQKQLLMRPNLSDDRNIQINPTQAIVM